MNESDIPQAKIVERVFDILMAQGEGLLNIDLDGVDPDIAASLADEIATDVIGNITCGTCTNWDMEGVQIHLCQECKVEFATQSDYNEKRMCEYCFIESKQ